MSRIRQEALESIGEKMWLQDFLAIYGDMRGWQVIRDLVEMGEILLRPVDGKTQIVRRRD